MRIPICRRGERAASMNRVKVREPGTAQTVGPCIETCECESQESSVMRGYLDVTRVFQIHICERICFKVKRVKYRKGTSFIFLAPLPDNFCFKLNKKIQLIYAKSI